MDDEAGPGARRSTLLGKRQKHLSLSILGQQRVPGFFRPDYIAASWLALVDSGFRSCHSTMCLRHVRDGSDWLDAERFELNADHLREIAQAFKKMDFANAGQFHLDDADFRRSMPRYEELVQEHRHGHASHLKERDVLYHHVEERKKAAHELAHTMGRTNDDMRHSGPDRHRIDPARLTENIEKHLPHGLQHEKAQVHAHAHLDPHPAKEHLRARAHESHRQAHQHDGDREKH